MKRGFLRLCGTLLAAIAPALLAPAHAQSLGPATPPGAKAAAFTTFLPLDLETPLRLEMGPMEDARIAEVKRANAAAELKRVQVGIGRATEGRAEASSAKLEWQAAGAFRVARWEVHSAGAKALRVGFVAGQVPAGLELRFAGDGDTRVFGPVTRADMAAAGPIYWSPVLEGELATIELRMPVDAGGDLALWIANVSHLFVSPSDPKADAVAKASGLCEVNLVCRAATDAALASTGTAVARMSFSEPSGHTYSCTGTVLNNRAGASIPYFATAAHCISTQAEASTLTTLWFYDSTTCSVSTPNPAQQQVDGGATLLSADTSSDFTLLRLNKAPPAGVTYAGWDASTVTLGLPVSAIHHPNEDVKKVSLGTIGGFGTSSLASGSFIIVNWNSTATGVTEGGSSGSGIFSGSDYKYRGGLLGGPSSCGASSGSLYDYYSRFDQAYPAVASFLSPTTCQYALSAPGTSVSADGGSGSFSIGAGAGCGWTPASGASWISVSGGGTGNGTVAFNVQANAGAARSGTITAGGQTFTVSQAAGAAAAGDNYTALWGNANEPGWGLDLSHQGDIIFSSLYTYADDGKPMWLYGSNVARQPDGSFSGPIYRATGPAFYAQPWSANTPTQVGTMTLRFGSASSGALSYSFNGTTVTKTITRFDFASPVPVCSATTASRATATNYQDLWWNAAEPGWGLDIAHQGNIIFASLFTYDDAGRDTWFYASNASRQADGSYSGTLYQATGPVFNTSPWTANAQAAVGTLTLRFGAGDAGTLSYTVGSRTVTKPITRFVIAGSLTVCR